MTFLTLTVNAAGYAKDKTDNGRKCLIALNRVFHFKEYDDYTSVQLQDGESIEVKETVLDIVSMLKTSQPNMFTTYIGL